MVWYISSVGVSDNRTVVDAAVCPCLGGACCGCSSERVCSGASLTLPGLSDAPDFSCSADMSFQEDCDLPLRPFLTFAPLCLSETPSVVCASLSVSPQSAKAGCCVFLNWCSHWCCLYKIHDLCAKLKENKNTFGQKSHLLFCFPLCSDLSPAVSILSQWPAHHRGL